MGRRRWGRIVSAENDVMGRWGEILWEYRMHCKLCGSSNVVKWGKTTAAEQRYRCRACGGTFVDTGAPPHMQFDADVIATTLNLFYEGQSLESIRRHLHMEHAQFPGHATVYDWIGKYTEKAVRALHGAKIAAGDIWAADETVIDVAGQKIKEGLPNTLWFWDCIDEETRFLLASYMSQRRSIQEAEMLFRLAANRAVRPPRIIVTDRLSSYIEAIERVFGAHTTHVQSQGMRTATHNNIIERFHGTLKDRTNIMRGMHSKETARMAMDGWLIHYNYFRPHTALKNQTPAQAAGFEAPFMGWRDVITMGWEQPFVRPRREQL